MELYSPQIQVSIGEYQFSKGIEIELSSSVDTYYDWVKVRFVSPFEQKVTVSRLDPASLLLGYNNQFSEVFTGYATCDFISGTTGNEVLLKDGMILLEAVKINNTFLAITPQEVIQYIANQAGVSSLAIDDTPYQPIARLPIIFRNGIQTIRELDTYWRLHQKFYFMADTLHWGKSNEQTQVYCFEYRKNMISLELADGNWELKTVSVPFVKHSQKIRVSHPKISGEFLVHRVRVISWGPGFIRTTLYFRGD